MLMRLSCLLQERDNYKRANSPMATQRPQSRVPAMINVELPAAERQRSLRRNSAYGPCSKSENLLERPGGIDLPRILNILSPKRTSLMERNLMSVYHLLKSLPYRNSNMCSLPVQYEKGR